MTRLPPHHVPRPRLTGRSEGYQVVVIEAAAGYGKSVLAAELVDTWRSVGIEAQLEHGGVSAPLLAARLLQGARRAGFSEAASAAEGKQDPVDLLDTLVEGLSQESCAFVIDDAHNVEPDSGATHIPPRESAGRGATPHRLGPATAPGHGPVTAC